ncbi:MAG TPA: hypothetical protein VIV34_09855 [Pseudolabrys sp.]
MRRFNNVTRTVALAGLFAVLGGCSEYLDRRDSIALSGGNAVATNVVTHTVDPWPRASANRNIAFNGQKMETAVERYRTNRVIAPRGTGTSASYQDSGSGGQNSAGPVGPPAATAPAAPVK